MDELSPLFQEIEFHERLRGYDPDEVDAYVDRVARAAAVLRGRLIELQERVEAAESRAHGAPPLSGGTESEETLTRTLVLAQRTADAAIAEAREEADRMTTDAATSAQAIVSAAEADAQVSLREAQAEAAATIRDAEDRAGLLLAEAETDRRTMLAEAEALAVQAATGERDRLAVEVAELQEYRAFLADDIEILERHLADERHQLTASLAALTDLLESPDAFRGSRAPATSGVEVEPERLEPIGSAYGDLLAPVDAPAEAPADDMTAEPDPAPEPEPVVAEVVESSDDDAAEIESEPEIAATDVVDDVAADLDRVTAGEVTAGEVTTDEVTADEVTVDEVEAELDEPEPVIDADAAPVDEPTIDLVEDEPVESADEPPADEPFVVETAAAIDLDAPLPPVDDEPGPGGWPADEPDWASGPLSMAGRVESRLEMPAEAPPRFVTAADLETPGGSRIAFDDGGPATAKVDAVEDLFDARPVIEEASLFGDQVEVAEDPFLAQLRDAMDNEVPPETDDEALSAFFDQEDDDGGRSWFGRRR